MTAHRRTTLAAAEVAYRMRELGYAWAQIAERLQCSQARVTALLRVAAEQRGEIQPVERGQSPQERRCCSCKVVKPIVSFGVNGDGYRMHRCQECWNARRREQARRPRRTVAGLAMPFEFAQWRPVWDFLRLPHVIGKPKGARVVAFCSAWSYEPDAYAGKEREAECATN